MMDRQVKYRVFDKQYGMFQVAHIDFINGEVHYLPDYDNINKCMIDEREIEYRVTTLSDLLEYTGIRDRHGKEIYEGDIIRFSRGYKEIKCVDVMEIGDIITGFWIYHSEEFSNDNVDTDTIEVIGNIYQNPELLNSGDEYNE